jgi:hypothetical protein
MRLVLIIVMAGAVLVARDRATRDLTGVWTLCADTVEAPGKGLTVMISQDAVRLRITELRRDEYNSLLSGQEYPLYRKGLETNPGMSPRLATARLLKKGIEIRFGPGLQNGANTTTIERWTIRTESNSGASLHRQLLTPHGSIVRTQVFKRAATVVE